MIESEDGTLTGSVDVSKLDDVKPKTDEAKAQLANLKDEVKAGQEQAAADAKRAAEATAASNPLVAEAPEDTRDAQGKPTEASDGSSSHQKAPADDKATKAPAAKAAAPSSGKG